MYVGFSELAIAIVCIVGALYILITYSFAIPAVLNLYPRGTITPIPVDLHAEYNIAYAFLALIIGIIALVLFIRRVNQKGTSGALFDDTL